jgi:hypothetical protein
MLRHVLAALLILISVTSIAVADLGNCLIVRSCDQRLGGAVEEVVSKYIYHAYASSEISDANLFFLVQIDDQLKPGSYRIEPIKLVRDARNSWTFSGYEIAAGDVTGILNGAVEVAKALESGNDAFSKLKTGTRNGLVTKSELKCRK